MVDTTRRNVLGIIGTGTGMALTSNSASAENHDDSGDKPFRNPEHSIDKRVDDLVGRLTTDEKVSLLHQYQPPIPRLGMESFRTGTEALHGVAWLGEATVFPQAIGFGSTWNPELIERVGDAVGDEVRGMHDKTSGGVGLNVWAPVVDPLRDPRWGRNEEGYSEDPFLTGAVAAAYASGLTGDDPDYLKTAPNLKHFFGYNNEIDRTTTNVELPPKLLHDYYLSFFKRPLKTGEAVGVMSSYNLVNGRPCTVTPRLDEVIRDWIPDGLSVMNVSDAWAPANLTGAQDYYDTIERSHAGAVLAGLDSFTEYGADNSTTVEAISGAIEQGYLSNNELTEVVRHILSVRFRLGGSENPYADITADVIGRPKHRELARQTAREQTVLLKNDTSSADSNDSVLPLSDQETVAVIGPLSDSVFEDWYSGTPPYRITTQEGIRDRIGSDQIITARGTDRIALRETSSGRYVSAGVGSGGGGLQLLENTAPSVQLFDATQWTQDAWTLQATANDRYVSTDNKRLGNFSDRPHGWETVEETFEFVETDDGVALHHHSSDRFVTVEDGELYATAKKRSDAATFTVETHQSGVDEAVEAVRGADAVVVMVGSHPLIGGRETRDRENLALPPAQRELVEAVNDAHPRTAMVLQSSYPVAVNWAEEHVPSIMWTSHAGQETGRALADVLFGDTSPAGRVPQTWPKSVEQLPDITNYNIARTEVTYRYDQEDPLYAFGHGLSYADFEYSDLRVPTRNRLAPDETATISVQVTNTGSMAADEVVQLYTRQRRSRVKQPAKVLRGFERVHLQPGENTSVEFEVTYDDFAFWDITRRKRVVERSNHAVFVGAASDDIREQGTLHVEGEKIPMRDLSEETRAVDADDWTWTDIALLDHSREEGTVVEISDGAWVSFADVDLRDRPDEAMISFANADKKKATIELRLNSPTGRTLGTAKAPSTGGIYEYEEITMPLKHTAGANQELYVVVRGGDVRIHTVQLR
jgi:beta-glucosidase